MPLSTSQVDRLGERLRDVAVPERDDLALLAEIQDSASRALWEVVLPCIETVLGPDRSFLGDPAFVSPRQLKTLNTIVEKLRRPPATIKLSQIQDLAGARIVCGGLGDEDRPSCAFQDDLVDALRKALSRSEINDRRARPSAGYRAVHVIARVERWRVEIQVRTGLQHAWANATERLADAWGRGIRYDRPPVGPDPAVIAERGEQLRRWIRLSDAISEMERHGPVLHVRDEPRTVAGPAAEFVAALRWLPAELQALFGQELQQADALRGPR